MCWSSLCPVALVCGREWPRTHGLGVVAGPLSVPILLFWDWSTTFRSRTVTGSRTTLEVGVGSGGGNRWDPGGWTGGRNAVRPGNLSLWGPDLEVRRVETLCNPFSERERLGT